MLKKLQAEIREHGRLRAGDRLGVAVSGGADSVALLRALHGLKKELGIVLTVLHFHHGIRGAEADRDEMFVAALAEDLQLECVIGRGDVPTHAKVSEQSLETAARELRYRFFESVLRSGAVDKIATAHTMDDQAETFLMRMLRGAGTRGLGGIHAAKDGSRVVRPLLGIRRSEIEAYLRSLPQEWREDATNEERKHFRNQVRHDLLPMLARDFNPNVVEVLARNAAVAQDEEEFWSQEIARLLPLVLLPGKPTRGGGRRASSGEESRGLNIEALRKHPLAVQRRLLLAAMRELAIEADAAHVEILLALTRGEGKAIELPGGWVASRTFRELRFEARKTEAAADYRYALKIPGEAKVAEMKLLVLARLEPISAKDGGYNAAQSGEVVLDGTSPLTIRNWRSGDRFWPGQSKGEKKVKEILQQMKVPAQERALWPVAVAGEKLVWVHGTRPQRVTVQHRGKPQRLVIEAQEL